MIKTDITNIGDPFVLVFENAYYMYSTSAEDGFKCFKSTDLINWIDMGYVYKDSPWGENCFWAPEVYHYENKFYLLYTARWSKNHSLRTGLAVSSSPLGPFIDINKGPLFDLGYATIDATFLLNDDNGRNYLYFVRDCSEQIINGVHTSTIYGVEVDKTLTQFIGEPLLLSKPDCALETTVDKQWQWNEGPAVIHLNGRYYLNYSLNPYYDRHYSIGCQEAISPLGPFKKYEDNPILAYKENEFSGPGHNHFFRSLDDNRLLTSFHIHTDYNRPSGDRRFCIGEVKFDMNMKMRIEV